MSDDDKEVPLWRNPIELMKAMVVIAPEMNIRVALVDLIDFMFDTEGTDHLTVNNFMEVIAQTLTNLHHHVGDDFRDDDEDHVPSDEELLEIFRKQMNGED